MFEVVYYDDGRGNVPIREFIDGLDLKMKAKVFGRIELLEEFGPGLRLPFSSSLGDGIFELRTVLGSDITRVLYFFMAGNRAVLTHGFVKKTQKTPRAEIERAKRLREDWLKRHGEL